MALLIVDGEDRPWANKVGQTLVKSAIRQKLMHIPTPLADTTSTFVRARQVQ
jgi:hypothetical protein